MVIASTRPCNDIKPLDPKQQFHSRFTWWYNRIAVLTENTEFLYGVYRFQISWCWYDLSGLEFTFNISSIFLDITVCCAYYPRPTKIKTVKNSGVGVYAYFRDHDVSVAAAIQVPDHETRSHEGMFREDVKQSDHTNPHKLLIHVHSCIVFTPFVWQTIETLELLHCLINHPVWK